jgi:hypothetical protein
MGGIKQSFALKKRRPGFQPAGGVSKLTSVVR